MDSRCIDIDGETYELLPWNYKDGQRWAFKLVRALAPAAAVHGSETAAFAAVLEGIDEETLTAFSNTCEGYTNVVIVGDNGEKLVKPLSKVAATHMRGKYFAMAALMRAHGEAQFGSFFGRLGELLRASGKPAG